MATQYSLFILVLRPTIRDSPAGPWLNSAEEISLGLGNDLCRGALIVDARQRRWFSSTPSIDSVSHNPPRRTTLSLGDLTCFRTRDSRERKEGRKSNSRACVRPPSFSTIPLTRSVTASGAGCVRPGVRKSLKGLAPSLAVYATSRRTAPCTCWSFRQTAAAIRYPGFLPGNTSPWIKHARCCEMQAWEIQESVTECYSWSMSMICSSFQMFFFLFHKYKHSSFNIKHKK